MAADLTPNPLIQHWRITLNPTPDRDMIDGEASLRHDLLQVAVCQGIAQIPPNAQENNYVFKMPTAEQCWPSSGHVQLKPHSQQIRKGQLPPAPSGLQCGQ